MEYESLEAFLKDRQLDHATDATHRFETGTGKMFAGLEDRKTREQDEFQDLAKHVGLYQNERVKVLEFLSPTFTLHFEITIYNGERSNLQSLVKSMTQAMLGSGSGTDGIWKMAEMKTYLYCMPFKTEAGEEGIYAQVVYPDVTVSKHQHTACLRLLRNKLGELKDVQEIVRKAPERNAPHQLLTEITNTNAPVPVPLTMHSVDNGPEDRIRPLFCVNISQNGVHKIPSPSDDAVWWCLYGLKRKDPHSDEGKETLWNQPDTGPKGKTKSGADRSSSGTTSTPDPKSGSSLPSRAS
jgi:hypothetical protein